MERKLIFIDTEFCPDSRQWLSLGAVCDKQLFYAETSDAQVLAAARQEFGDNPIGMQVLSQLGVRAFSPGQLPDLASMGRAFAYWADLVTHDGPVDICYDYSTDMDLLEQALAAAGIAWPKNWFTCNLAILNEDPSADAARDAVWREWLETRALRRHHALADAAALQAAYAVQSKA